MVGSRRADVIHAVHCLEAGTVAVIRAASEWLTARTDVGQNPIQLAGLGIAFFALTRIGLGGVPSAHFFSPDGWFADEDALIPLNPHTLFLLHATILAGAAIWVLGLLLADRENPG